MTRKIKDIEILTKILRSRFYEIEREIFEYDYKDDKYYSLKQMISVLKRRIEILDLDIRSLRSDNLNINKEIEINLEKSNDLKFKYIDYEDKYGTVKSRVDKYVQLNNTLRQKININNNKINDIVNEVQSLNNRIIELGLRVNNIPNYNALNSQYGILKTSIKRLESDATKGCFRNYNTFRGLGGLYGDLVFGNNEGAEAWFNLLSGRRVVVRGGVRDPQDVQTIQRLNNEINGLRNEVQNKDVELQKCLTKNKILENDIKEAVKIIEIFIFSKLEIYIIETK